MLGYAVIDTETTGLNIRGNDRIVEIAVVLLDMNLNVTATYETVLNPERDLGLVSLHGIDGLMASHGTSFRTIMPSLSGLLHNRVIVGHNVSFDIGMMEDEYAKEGGAPDFGKPVDTLRLAKSLPFYVSNYKLHTLCEYFRIPLTQAHTAKADTVATATLFTTLVNNYQAHANCYPADFSGHPMSNDFSAWTARNEIHTKLSEPADLSAIVRRLHDYEAELSEASIETYLKTLHLSLLNSRVSSWERDIMERITTDLSLTRSHAVDLNEEYLFMLICRNLHKNNGRWQKGTDITHFQAAAAFTDISESRVNELIHQTLQESHHIQPTVEKLSGYFSFVQGDSFVVTGEDFQYDKSYWEGLLGSKGFVPKQGITKVTKLVLAGDPYSLSAKAVKARKYGIPVISENTMSTMMGM